MEPYRDFKASMTCLFRVHGAGISVRASDIRKIWEGHLFHLDKNNYQISDIIVFNDIKGSDYQVSQLLKLVNCYRYVIELRRAYEFY